jgi:hypothetical protein
MARRVETSAPERSDRGGVSDLPSIAPFPGGRIVRHHGEVYIYISGDEIARELGGGSEGQPNHQRDELGFRVRCIRDTVIGQIQHGDEG